MNSYFGDKKPKDKYIRETNMAGMIDIETMGNKPGCPIVTIGATLFDPYKCDSMELLNERSFLRRVDIKDAVDNSLGVEGDTLRWWLSQEDAAIKELIGDDALSLKQALLDLHDFLLYRGSSGDTQFKIDGFCKLPVASTFWAKDPDFDMAIMRYGYEAVNAPMPWKFWECRSVRTIQDVAWPDPADRPVFAGGTLHDARDDAVSQAMLIQAGFKELGIGKDVVFSRWESEVEHETGEIK